MDSIDASLHHFMNKKEWQERFEKVKKVITLVLIAPLKKFHPQLSFLLTPMQADLPI